MQKNDIISGCRDAFNRGLAAAAFFRKNSLREPRIMVGTDHMRQSELLFHAFCTGLMAAGADCISVGMLPVSAAPFLIPTEIADGGVMITASADEVFRYYSSSGTELMGDETDRISGTEVFSDVRATGRFYTDETANEKYSSFILRSAEHDLNGMTVAVDCSDGSSSLLAEKIFSDLGARVYLLDCENDGVTTSEQSEYTDRLSVFVRERRCSAGIYISPLGDRCIAVDENGAIIDGSTILAVLAKDMMDRDMLSERCVTATVDTNLGFTHFAAEQGIRLITAKSGGCYLSEQMKASGCILGGDGSGEIIFRDRHPVSDGFITALELLSAVKRSGKKLSELSSVMERYSRVILSVKIGSRWTERWKNIPEIEDAIAEMETKLDGSGRIIVREIAAESVIRIIAEGRNFDTVNVIAPQISDVIRRCCPSE